MKPRAYSADGGAWSRKSKILLGLLLFNGLSATCGASIIL